jgi:hypothetical protein
MRINRQTLLKIAEDTVAQRARQERDIVSAFLIGSLLEEDYLLGGTTDIDLVFIHAESAQDEREIVRLTDEVHLDIAHYPQKTFRQTRNLRRHPRLGPAIFSCKILYDPQHFMDFTQASVRGQFDRPDYIIDRARQQAEFARQTWMSFYTNTPKQSDPQEIYRYIKALEHAANAVASLYGAPLTERRFLLAFHDRATAANRLSLYPGILELLGAPNVEKEALQIWLTAWRTCLEALPKEKTPTRISPHRIHYYLRAFEFILDGDQSMAVLYPLMRTWTLAACQLPDEAEPLAAWQKACQYLGWLGAGFTERVEALDAYLDSVEEVLDGWAQANGV